MLGAVVSTNIAVNSPSSEVGAGVSCSILSDSLQSHGLQTARLLYPISLFST